MIAALFVERDGVYSGLPDVDVWDVTRDARTYRGPHAVVCHPPCERWGRYWSGGPSARERRSLGDDAGCFAAAIVAVETWGGVLEHPEASHAWRAFGLRRPVGDMRGFGWILSNRIGQCGAGWVCCVEQGHYGHPARKATWLYACHRDDPRWRPPDLIWGPSQGNRLDEGFHSKAERDAARAAGRKPVPRLSRDENIATPIAFRDALIGIAQVTVGARRAA